MSPLGQVHYSGYSFYSWKRKTQGGLRVELQDSMSQFDTSFIVAMLGKTAGSIIDSSCVQNLFRSVAT